jgi:DNA polymerase-3 subunit delta
LQNIPPQSVLSFRYNGKPGAKIKKAFSGDKVLFYEAPRIYDNQIPGLIEDLLKYKGFSADTKAVFMLGEFVGTDLSRLEMEIDKLSVVLEQGTRITPEMIEKYIGISKDFNIFEFKSAIASGDFPKASKIAWFFAQNPREYSLYAIVAVLYGFFTQLYKYWTLNDRQNRSKVASALKINPYFVPELQKAARYYNMKKISEVMQVLRDTDLKVKGLGAGRAEYKDLINEMIYKIMN